MTLWIFRKIQMVPSNCPSYWSGNEFISIFENIVEVLLNWRNLRLFIELNLSPEYGVIEKVEISVFEGAFKVYGRSDVGYEHPTFGHHFHCIVSQNCWKGKIQVKLQRHVFRALKKCVSMQTRTFMTHTIFERLFKEMSCSAFGKDPHEHKG